MPTLEALLLLPRPEATASEAPPAPSSPPSASTQAIQVSAVAVLPVDVVAPERDEGKTKTGRASHRPSPLRIELSAFTAAGIGDGQTSVGVGALSLLDIDGWLVGFEGRADRDQRIGADSQERHWSWQPWGADVFAFGVSRWTSWAGPPSPCEGRAEAPAPPRGPVEARPRRRARAPSRARSSAPHVIFGARSSFRTFLGVDAELGPANAPGGSAGDAFRLPVWTVGLALGATVGTR